MFQYLPFLVEFIPETVHQTKQQFHKQVIHSHAGLSTDNPTSTHNSRIIKNTHFISPLYPPHFWTAIHQQLVSLITSFLTASNSHLATTECLLLIHVVWSARCPNSILCVRTKGQESCQIPPSLSFCSIATATHSWFLSSLVQVAGTDNVCDTHDPMFPWL